MPMQVILKEETKLHFQVSYRNPKPKGNEPEEEDIFPAEPVAQGPSCQTGKYSCQGKHGKERPRLGHPHIEPLGNIEGKKGEQDCPAETVDKGGTYEYPETSRIFVKRLFNAPDHRSAFVRSGPLKVPLVLSLAVPFHGNTQPFIQI